MSGVLAVVGWALAAAGAAVMAVAAVALHRFDDPAVRLHVAAKATSSGVLTLLVGLAMVSQDRGVGLELGLTGLLLAITVPLATHGLSRAILRPDADGDGPGTRS